MTLGSKDNGVQIAQLRAFVTVARTGNLTVAAELLGYTQPAVHLQLASLSRAAGGPVLIHARRRMELTRLGQSLLPFAEEAVKAVEALVCEAERHKARQHHVIRIGLGRSVGSYLFPFIESTIHAYHPEIRIETSIMPLSEIFEALENDRIDVGMGTGLRGALSRHRERFGQFVGVPLTRYEWRLLASPVLSQRLARESDPVPLLVPEYASRLVPRLEALLTSIGQFHISVAGHTEVAKAAARAGLAVAYIPVYTSRHELASGELIRCLPEVVLPTWTIDVAHRRPATCPDVAQFVSSVSRLRGFLSRTPSELSYLQP